MKKTKASHLLTFLAVCAFIGLAAVTILAGCPRFARVSGRAKIRATAAQIDAFQGALERYKLDMDRYPTTEEGLFALVTPPDDEDEARKWHGPYVERIPKDSWNHEFVYKCPGDVNEDSYDIISFGHDGEEGTDDDIKNYEEED